MISWFPRTSSEQNRRQISIRSGNPHSGTVGSGIGLNSGGSRGFSFASLRGATQPELSKRLFKLIKSENTLVTAHETAGRERISVATQLSEWGEQTNDDSISDISDKVGVILSEIGEQEEVYAHALDDSRSILKVIRNTEKSVQPSRDGKAKIADEIAKIKSKENDSPRLVVLEQELVRAEAENLVAEAQLSNITRQKLKEAFEAEFAATIERAEKQIILARHGQRLLRLLDDTPVVPGDGRPTFPYAAQARQVLNDAEDDLRDWRPEQLADDERQAGGSGRGRQDVTENGDFSDGGGAAQASPAKDNGRRNDDGIASRSDIPDTPAAAGDTPVLVQRTQGSSSALELTPALV